MGKCLKCLEIAGKCSCVKSEQERIESLETAVKQKTVINDSILELIYTNSKRIDEVEKKLDAILKEMKTFNETNAH